MVTDAFSEGEASSRRSALLAAGAGLAGVLAGCGTASIRQQVHNSPPVLQGDVDLLNRLLHVEHVAVVRAALGQPAIPSAFVTGRE